MRKVNKRYAAKIAHALYLEIKVGLIAKKI